MKTSILLSLALVGSLAIVRVAPAQDELSPPLPASRPAHDLRRDGVDDAGPILSGTVAPTPEMWFYSQERRRQDSPKQAVRRNAELRAANRVARMESLAWQGTSAARPTMPLTPSFSTASSDYWWANWRSGNMIFQPIAVTR